MLPRQLRRVPPATGPGAARRPCHSPANEAAALVAHEHSAERHLPGQPQADLCGRGRSALASSDHIAALCAHGRRRGLHPLGPLRRCQRGAAAAAAASGRRVLAGSSGAGLLGLCWRSVQRSWSSTGWSRSRHHPACHDQRLHAGVVDVPRRDRGAAPRVGARLGGLCNRAVQHGSGAARRCCGCAAQALKPADGRRSPTLLGAPASTRSHSQPVRLVSAAEPMALRLSRGDELMLAAAACFATNQVRRGHGRRGCGGAGEAGSAALESRRSPPPARAS